MISIDDWNEDLVVKETPSVKESIVIKNAQRFCYLYTLVLLFGRAHVRRIFILPFLCFRQVTGY